MKDMIRCEIRTFFTFTVTRGSCEAFKFVIGGKKKNSLQIDFHALEDIFLDMIH